MGKDRGLIIKQIPYGDSSRIIKCFTQSQGLQTLFVRTPKKGSLRALLQIGSFIEFTAINERQGNMIKPKEIKWDENIPNEAINHQSQAVWMFSIELLHKSLAEGLILTQLHKRVYAYYLNLFYENISSSATVTLLNISASLGLIDLNSLSNLLPAPILADLNKLTWTLNPIHSTPLNEIEIFNSELERFVSHFGIKQINSLNLINFDE